MKRELMTHLRVLAFVGVVPLLAGAKCSGGVPDPDAPRSDFVKFCAKQSKDPRLGCGACVALANCGYCYSPGSPADGECMYTGTPGQPSSKCDQTWAQNDLMCPAPPPM